MIPTSTIVFMGYRNKIIIIINPIILTLTYSYHQLHWNYLDDPFAKPSIPIPNTVWRDLILYLCVCSASKAVWKAMRPGAGTSRCDLHGNTGLLSGCFHLYPSVRRHLLPGIPFLSRAGYFPVPPPHRACAIWSPWDTQDPLAQEA